jgi:hypothetical protein
LWLADAPPAATDAIAAKMPSITTVFLENFLTLMPPPSGELRRNPTLLVE